MKLLSIILLLTLNTWANTSIYDEPYHERMVELNELEDVQIAFNVEYKFYWITIKQKSYTAECFQDYEDVHCKLYTYKTARRVGAMRVSKNLDLYLSTNL